MFTFSLQPNYGNDAYQYASSSSTSSKAGRSSNFYNKEPVEWTNIIPTIDDPRPSSQFRNRFTYTGNFVFYGLAASTEYEVIIQSRNKEGWSDASDIFRFSTRDRGMTIIVMKNFVIFVSDHEGWWTPTKAFLRKYQS